MIEKLTTFEKGSCTLLLIMFLPGCGVEYTSNSCEESVSVLSSEEAVSPLLGESGAELLAAIDASVTDIANYADNEAVLTQEPTGGTSEITISTVYNAGEIREIESIKHEGTTEEDINCLSRLEMDVTVEVETADGALLESWPAVLYREVGSAPILKAGFDPNGTFNGSFHIVSYNNPSNPEKVTGELVNRFSENATDNNGYIWFELTFREGDVVGGTTHTALTW